MVTEGISDKHHLLLRSCSIDRILDGKKENALPNEWADYHILYVSKGLCHLILNGEKQVLSEGHIILFRPQEKQKYSLDEQKESVFYHIHFTGKDAKEILTDLGLWEHSVLFMGKSKEFEETFAAMHMEYYLKKSDFFYSTSALLLKLLVVISRKYKLVKGEIGREQTGKMQSIIETMYRQMGEAPSVEALASQSGYSVGRFSHLFKEVIGTAPHTYMTDLRLSKAKDLLLNTHYSVAEVARAIGFPNQNYFSRFFRKHVGVSPSEYRKNEE